MDFRVLGPVQVLAGDRPVRVSGPRQERVLAALVLDAGHVVPVSRLVEVVWDGDPPATAVRQVRNVTSALRRALVAAGFPHDVLTATGPGFVLNPPDSDLARFERHAAAEEYREALACWRGPALAGVTSHALAGEVARLEEKRLTILEAHLARAGDIAELTAAVAQHPLREGLAALLIQALWRQGRTADALLTYRRTRDRLAAELGVEPGPALRALHARIQRDGSACYLPYRTPDFTGRRRELDLVLGALHGGNVVLVHGMAGVGKTALAVHAAHRAASRFPDGQLFVDLHGYSPGRDPLDPAAALSSLLLQVGVPAPQHPGSLDDRAALWRARTSGRALLVLLDNAAGAHHLLPLLPGSASVAVLATSRRRLTAVDGAVPVPLDVLPETDAAALFTAVSGRRDHGVARLCGGLPLAIRIAASRVRHQPGRAAERLAGRRSTLRELRTTDRDVAAAFALSYRDLGEPQRYLFRVLGIHPGPLVTPDAAAALTGLPDTERLLDDLCDAHLLSRPHPDGYTFHDLLAEYARDLVRPGEARAARDRLLGYYRDGGDTAWHARERPNLRAVAEFALAQRCEVHAWRIADHAAQFLRVRGHRDDFAAVARAGFAAAERLGDTEALLRSLDNLANAQWDSGDLDAAMNTTRRRLRLAVDDPAAQASALSRIGTLHGMRGDYRTAITYYRQALDVPADERLTALVLGNLSHAQEILGDFADALTSISQARDLRERTDDRHGSVLSDAQYAHVLARLGRTRDAVGTASEAVSRAVRLGYPFGEAWARTDLADVLLAANRPAEAREHAGRARDLLMHLDHPLLLAMAANSLGDAHHALGETALARECYRLARETATRVGYRRERERAERGLARDLGDTGVTDRGRRRRRR
ncbi:BTAD domain-containing putative transcriptional regulator [Amycolatopsis tucumanensis]|uniref:AfsR/SARP family transcriptional regulator n=1 Tax=Amycolatopsis tucumanensis TaxID=401106 RepID=UPI003D745618